MDGTRRLLRCLAIFACTAGCQAGCAWLPRPPAQQVGPPVLPPSPTLPQIIQAVNQNSSQIHSFSTNQATLSGQGFPTLRASLAFERPQRFRLLADTAFTGAEVDLGSNDELFWMWVRRNQPPALLYCRHDQFANSPARRMIPVEPAWLIEALGVAQFDPALPHQGPYPMPNGQLQVRTVRETPEGPTTKITVLDASRALVLAQHVYDHRGQLAASAVAHGHRRDPLTGLIMPRVVDVSCPAAQLALRIDLGNVTINSLQGDRTQLFRLPSYEGWQMVDLGDPNLQMPQAPATVTMRSAAPYRRSSRTRR